MHSHSGGDSVSESSVTLNSDEDAQSVYAESLRTSPPGAVVLFQNVTHLEKADSLFYTDAQVDDKVLL